MKLFHYDDVELEKAEAGAKDTYVRWLITRKDGAKNFAMRRFTIGKDGHTPYHSHDDEHVFLF